MARGRTMMEKLAEIGHENTRKAIAMIETKYNLEKNVNRAVYRYIREFFKMKHGFTKICQYLHFLQPNDISKSLIWLEENGHIEKHVKWLGCMDVKYYIYTIKGGK